MGIGNSKRKQNRQNGLVLSSYDFAKRASVSQFSLRVQLQYHIIGNNILKCKEILQSCDKINELLTAKLESSHEFMPFRVFNTTPLHLSCMYRKPAILELLLQHGADPYLRDSYGKFPAVTVIQYWPRVSTLRMVCSDPFYKNYVSHQHHRMKLCFLHLINHGFKLSSVINENLETLLHLCGKLNVEVPIRILVESMADTEARDIYDQTPLITASKYCSLRAVRELVGLRADVNARDHTGRGALHYVCRKAVNKSEIEWLLQHGADLWVPDKKGNTALHVAARAVHEEQILSLLKYGADPDLKNSDGQSSLYLLLNDPQKAPSKHLIANVLSESLYASITDKDGTLPRLLTDDNFSSFTQFIAAWVRTPPSLLWIARHKVRREMLSRHRCNEENVSELALPRYIQKIILGCTYG